MKLLLAACLALLAPSAGAHEMSIAEMELRQLSPTEFLWQWTASGARPANDELTPVWPQGCSTDANVLRCGESGLRGTLAVEGVGKRYSAAMVKVHWLDGGVRVYTITSAQPTARLYGSADDPRGMGEIASAYTVLGVEHILTGYDHLLFVFGLLFLVGFNRRLIWTITAFTAAHSVTLALAALGWLTLRSPPVEATIALSIMLVAGEALHKQPTLSRRWPAVVAFLFGLVHGLGFAGALKDIGLPQNHLAVALLTFNLGVELGQLLVVGAAFVLWRALARLPNLVPARVAALYVIGSVAAYWSFERIVAILAQRRQARRRLAARGAAAVPGARCALSGHARAGAFPRQAPGALSPPQPGRAPSPPSRRRHGRAGGRAQPARRPGAVGSARGAFEHHARRACVRRRRAAAAGRERRAATAAAPCSADAIPGPPRAAAPSPRLKPRAARRFPWRGRRDRARAIGKRIFL